MRSQTKCKVNLNRTWGWLRLKRQDFAIKKPEAIINFILFGGRGILINSLFIIVLCSFLCPLHVRDTVLDREDTVVTSDLMRECFSCLCFLQVESEFIFVIHQRTRTFFDRISSQGVKNLLKQSPPPLHPYQRPPLRSAIFSPAAVRLQALDHDNFSTAEPKIVAIENGT